MTPSMPTPLPETLERPCRHEWFERECIHCGIGVQDYRAALTAAPQPAMREETELEHIARDIREGRFPERSPRQQVPVEAAPQPATPGQRMIRSAFTRPSAPETVCHAQEGIGRMECHKCRKSWALDDPRLPPCREDEA